MKIFYFLILIIVLFFACDWIVKKKTDNFELINFAETNKITNKINEFFKTNRRVEQVVSSAKEEKVEEIVYSESNQFNELIDDPADNQKPIEDDHLKKK